MNYKLIVDIFFPRFCVGCGAEGSLLCSRCLDKIDSKRNDTGCPLCGGKSDYPKLCNRCRKDTDLSAVISLGEFKKELREALHALKYEDVKEISKVLGDMLAMRCKELDIKPGIIIPIPLGRARARERGYNQSALIAKRLSKNLGWPYLDALARTRKTKPQTKLNRAQRKENLKDAFVSKFDFKKSKRPVYILDDVITTGATLSSASQALKKAGACRISAITVAID